MGNYTPLIPRVKSEKGYFLWGLLSGVSPGHNLWSIPGILRVEPFEVVDRDGIVKGILCRLGNVGAVAIADEIAIRIAGGVGVVVEVVVVRLGEVSHGVAPRVVPVHVVEGVGQDLVDGGCVLHERL